MFTHIKLKWFVRILFSFSFIIVRWPKSARFSLMLFLHFCHVPSRRYRSWLHIDTFSLSSGIAIVNIRTDSSVFLPYVLVRFLFASVWIKLGKARYTINKYTEGEMERGECNTSVSRYHFVEKDKSVGSDKRVIYSWISLPDTVWGS